MENLLTVETARELTHAAAALEAVAMAHVEQNAVEAGWFLRGVSDALAGTESAQPADRSYTRHYRAGYDSVTEARRVVGL